MPNTDQIIRKEINNQNQGKGASAATRKKIGVTGTQISPNPTKKGGVNRATKGR